MAIAAWLALTPALVRGLGPEGFGVWSLFYALTGWLGSLDLGFAQVALRFGASARARDAGAEAGEYATLAALGYVALGLLWLAAVALLRDPALDLLHIHGPARASAALAFLVGSPVFVFSGLTNTTTAVLQAWDRFDLANAVTVSVSLAQVAGLLLALSNGAAFSACLGAILAGWILAAVIGAALIARGAPGFRWADPRAALARLPQALGFGMPLQLANGLGVLHQQIGKLLLVRMLSLASVVPYELGLRVATACSTFAQLVLVAMIPEASVLHAQEQSERLRELHRRAGRFVTAAAAVVTAALVASAPSLFAAWLGHPEPAAALALRGLSLAAFAAVAGGVTGAIVRGVGRTPIELEWSGLALSLHVTLGLLLVPRYGLLGALVALLVANVAAALWFAFRLARALDWPVARMLWEPFLVPACGMAVGVATGEAASRGIGAEGWLGLVAAAATASVTCGIVLLAMRHVAWSELVSLARRGAGR